MRGTQGADGRIRVLWLIRGLGRGGAEQLLVQHARVHDRDAFRLAVAYVRADKDHLAPALEAEGVGVIPLTSGFWPWQLARLLARGDFDIVHAHSPSLAPLARVVGRLRGRKVVYTEHNRWDPYRWPSRLANALTYPLDHVHYAVSADAASSVPTLLRRRLGVVTHGIDVEATTARRAERDAARAELGVGDGQVVVVSVANLRPEKAPVDLVAVAAIVLHRHPEAVFVTMGDGPLREQHAAAIAALPHGERFVHLGYHPDPVHVMAGADVFTLSSHHEGLPVTIMDAVALGLPVAATAVGGIHAALGPHASTHLVEPRRPDLLAEAISRLVSDAATRAALGAETALRAAAFDAQRSIREIEARYRSLVPARRVGRTARPDAVPEVAARG
jgi:glycosyltransferase involved in cell wall biosynthesis